MKNNFTVDARQILYWHVKAYLTTVFVNFKRVNNVNMALAKHNLSRRPLQSISLEAGWQASH